MSELAAICCLRLSAEALRGQLRSLLGQALRRAGTFGKLSVAGAVSCAGAAQEETCALLWSSAYGARAEVVAVLEELASDADLMPFDFISSLPIVAAVHAAQHAASIKFGVFLPAGADAAETWPRLLQLALCWLDAGRCDRVVCGWVEEAWDQPAGHISHWLALTRTGLAATPLATVQQLDGPQQCGDRGAGQRLPGVAWKGAELVPALQNWLACAGGEARPPVCAGELNPDLPAPTFSAGAIQFARLARN
jgi:hypothetical protein